MLRPSGTLGSALLLAACLALSAPESRAQAQPPQASPQKAATVSSAAGHKSKGRAKKPEPVAEVPQAPTAPPTLEQQPPAAPQVTYRNGQLSINSTNATLSQVLRSVQTQTGASIDIPPGAGSERVVATLGPGAPKDVLASLLNGSKFNYVLLGEPKNPGAIQKVILLAKSSAGGDSAVTTAQNNVRSTPPPPQGVEPPEDEYQQPEPEVENQNLTPGQPGMPGSEGLTPDVINPAGRTPEQMLQELQRMQQQQQQMQQQLNPANQQQPQTFNPGNQQQPFPSQPPGGRPQPQ